MQLLVAGESVSVLFVFLTKRACLPAEVAVLRAELLRANALRAAAEARVSDRDKLLRKERRRLRREVKTTDRRARQDERRSSKAKARHRKVKAARGVDGAARRDKERKRKRKALPDGEPLHSGERKRQRGSSSRPAAVARARPAAAARARVAARAAAARAAVVAAVAAKAAAVGVAAALIRGPEVLGVDPRSAYRHQHDGLDRRDGDGTVRQLTRVRLLVWQVLSWPAQGPRPYL